MELDTTPVYQNHLPRQQFEHGFLGTWAWPTTEIGWHQLSKHCVRNRQDLNLISTLTRVLTVSVPDTARGWEVLRVQEYDWCPYRNWQSKGEKECQQNVPALQYGILVHTDISGAKGESAVAQDSRGQFLEKTTHELIWEGGQPPEPVGTEAWTKVRRSVSSPRWHC